MGINRFIKNAKECLYKEGKMNKRSQSKAYGLNTFKFNKVFQTNQKPTRFVTTKKIDYYNPNNLNNKRNFGYYRPKRNLNLSYLSSTNNSKKYFNNKRKKMNNYTTTNNDSINTINYNLQPVNKKKRYFSSEKNTEYNKEKSSSLPKKIRINIKTYKFNNNKNKGINNNILNQIRERITNNNINNKYNASSTRNQNTNKRYSSTNKNRSLDYDSDYNNKKNIRNMSSCSMNNIYESEESNSSGLNSSPIKERIHNKNSSINYESGNIKEDFKEDENDIYKKNKNITTPELGCKINNIFAKNNRNKYDNDDDNFFNENLPISVNLNNFENITGSCSKRSQKDNFTQRDKIRINFNDINDKKKGKTNNNYGQANGKILFNTIFSPKSLNTKKNNNYVCLQKNKFSRKKEIALKDNDKLNKEIWNYKKNKTNTSALDINQNDNINAENEKMKNKYNNLNNTQIQLSVDDYENSKLNKTTVNYKKETNKNGLKDIRDNTPLDLNCLLNLTTNDIKSKAKIFFKKFGFFYSEKDNIIKATRGGTIIEMTLFKLSNEFNNIYFNIRIKTNDFKKEREIMRKLIISLNKKE